MSIQDRYFEYAEAFEKSYVDDDWSRLPEYFTADAVYENEPIANGRDAVVAKLQGAVGGFDQLMDSRKLEIYSASVTGGDTVTVHWTARYTKTGAPDLILKGVEHARFEGNRIVRLWDVFDPGVTETLGTWMAAHGQTL